jgi:hypothetical protein
MARAAGPAAAPFAEERIAAQVMELGFAALGAYLEDRLFEREWLLVDVAAELAAYRRTHPAADAAGRGQAVKRVRAELGVGRSWLVAQMARLGLR